jgi:hypothetical protein
MNEKNKLKIVRKWKTKSGYTALILKMDMGHLCGYIQIKDKDILFKKGYSENINELLPLIQKAKEKPIGKKGIIDVFCWDGEKNTMGIAFDIHGGITFSGEVLKKGDWWIGFDTAHAGDTPLKCNEEYCINECESLAEQVKEANSYKDNWFEFHPLFVKGKLQTITEVERVIDKLSFESLNQKGKMFIEVEGLKIEVKKIGEIKNVSG